MGNEPPQKLTYCTNRMKLHLSPLRTDGRSEVISAVLTCGARLQLTARQVCQAHCLELDATIYALQWGKECW